MLPQGPHAPRHIVCILPDDAEMIRGPLMERPGLILRYAGRGLLLVAILFRSDLDIASSAELPAVRMTVTKTGNTWSYEVINGGTHPISIVSLFLEAPFEVSRSPPGWTVETDNCSTVAWRSTDEQPPFAHDIAPGTTMAGFAIRSKAKTSTPGQYVVQAWNLRNGTMGQAFRGQVSVPESLETHCAHDWSDTPAALPLPRRHSGGRGVHIRWIARAPSRVADPSRQGLVALWREGPLAGAVLRGRTDGYRHHPQLQRFRSCPSPRAAINRYLALVHAEALARGYAFDRSRLGRAGSAPRIPITDEQLQYEWTWLLSKLRRRSPAAYRRNLGVALPVAHPPFRVVPGPIAEWEHAQ
jgi:hypothetical protein